MKRTVQTTLLFVVVLLCSVSCRQAPQQPKWRVTSPYEARAHNQSQWRVVPVPEVRAPQEPTALPEELTLRRAILQALDTNKSIRVVSLDEDVAQASIMAAEGEFDPALFMEATGGRTRMPVAGDPLGETDTSGGDARVGIEQRLPTGTNWDISVSSDRARDRTGASFFDPTYSSSGTLSVRQDLLKNFGIDINRTDIILAQNNAKVSQEELRDGLMTVLLAVEQAYWRLYFAEADLKVREKQLERANRLVERARAQVEVGISAPLEIIRAESSAAAQTTSIVQARNAVVVLRNRLLRELGIIDPLTVGTPFRLTDAPPGTPHEIALEEAVVIARLARPDCTQARLRVANAELERRFAKNQRLPTLQLFGEYGLAGLGDDFSGSASSARDFDSWRVGLAFRVPLFNRTARADYRIAQYELRKANEQLSATDETLVREIADALDGLRTSAQVMETSRRARELAEKVLRNEEKSFELGLSDSLDVLNAQANLADAERDEVRAKTNHAIALAAFYRAQGILLEEKGISFLACGRR